MNDVIINNKYYKQHLFHCKKNRCPTCKFYKNNIGTPKTNISCFETFLLKHNLIKFTDDVGYLLRVNDEEVEYINNNIDSLYYDDDDVYYHNETEGCRDNIINILLTKKQISDANNLSQKLIMGSPYDITNVAAVIIKRRIMMHIQNIIYMHTAKIMIDALIRVNVIDEDDE